MFVDVRLLCILYIGSMWGFYQWLMWRRAKGLWWKVRNKSKWIDVPFGNIHIKIYNIWNLFDRRTLLWLIDSQMVLFQIMMYVKSRCRGCSRQCWRLKFWKLSLSTSCGFVDYNVMMNVAKKKRSSFPDSVWPSTNICGWCELECWWMGGHQYFFFFPEHLLLQSTISITQLEVSEIILCIISEFIRKGLWHK